MKRRELLRHLVDHGCHLLREGGDHYRGNTTMSATPALEHRLSTILSKHVGHHETITFLSHSSLLALISAH